MPIPAAHSAVDVGRLSHYPLLSGTRRPWNLATAHPRPRHDGAVRVRAARRRAPRASEDSNARGRLFGGGPSPSVRAGLRLPFFFYLDAASRLSHAAVRARRRNVSPMEAKAEEGKT